MPLDGILAKQVPHAALHEARHFFLDEAEQAIELLNGEQTRPLASLARLSFLAEPGPVAGATRNYPRLAHFWLSRLVFAGKLAHSDDHDPCVTHRVFVGLLMHVLVAALVG